MAGPGTSRSGPGWGTGVRKLTPRMAVLWVKGTAEGVRQSAPYDPPCWRILQPLQHVEEGTEGKLSGAGKGEIPFKTSLQLSTPQI